MSISISFTDTNFCQTARVESVGLVPLLPAADLVARTTVEGVVVGEAGEEEIALATTEC